MEQLKKELLQFGCKGKVAAIVLLVLGLLNVGLGFGLRQTDYAAFDPYGKAHEYEQLDVVYAMGPFADNGEQYCYVMEDADGYWNLVATGKNCPVPVYGEDIMDDDIDDLTPKTLRGKTTSIPSSMAQYLVEFFQDGGYDITLNDYEDYFGYYYLDTTDTFSSGSIVCFVFGGILAFLALIWVISFTGRKKKVKQRIDELEQQGLLNRLYADYSMGQYQWYKLIRLGVFAHYVVDFGAVKEGFEIYPLEDVTNVFRCNMVNGEPTAESYIALETLNGQRKLLTPRTGELRELPEAIDQIKRSIMGGARW